MKAVKIIVVIAIVVGIGFAIYKYKSIQLPEVEVLNVDWKKNIANIKIGGQPYTLTENVAVQTNTNNFAVQFSNSFRTDMNRIGPTSISITKNGTIYRTIARL